MMWIVFLLFLASCRTEYVPIEVVRTDSLMISELTRDSVFMRDSVFVRERGDTVYLYKDKYVYVLREVADTVYMERVREVDVPVMVERKLTAWEKLKDEYGGWAMVLMLIILYWKTTNWLARKTRRE